MAWRYTSTKSGAELRPSNTVFVYASGVDVPDRLRGPDGNLLGEKPCMVLSRAEFRELLAESGSAVTLATTAADG